MRWDRVMATPPRRKTPKIRKAKNARILRRMLYRRKCHTGNSPHSLSLPVIAYRHVLDLFILFEPHGTASTDDDLITPDSPAGQQPQPLMRPISSDLRFSIVLHIENHSSMY